MSIALNEYATKAFSEHPIALWSLDDDAYFVSLIDDSKRLFDAGNWTVSDNAIVEDFPSLDGLPSSPFPLEVHSKISVEGAENDEILEAISAPLFQIDSLNSSMKSFCINLFVYQQTINVKEYEFGYRYSNSEGEEVDVVTVTDAPEDSEWINFNITTPIPTDYLNSYAVRLIFRAKLEQSTSPTQQYSFITNGISIGQWSEISCYKNLGAEKQDVSFLSLNNINEGVAADQYGLLSENAFYLIENNRLLADNNGLTMVFGSENSTNIVASQFGNPSFVFPGKDVFYTEGRYKEFTLEMWMLIDPNTKESRRILGPLSSDDGIYIRDSSIAITIGDNIASHNVMEWYRPMLIHLLFKESSASLLINGEVVATVPMDRNSIQLTSELNWWGVYSYEDVDTFRIDCISIYPYIFPVQIAKKRFVWGQGVETLQFIDSEFKGTTMSVDFSTSNYDAGQIYPDVARWDAGYFNNLSANQLSLSTPEYSLPEINLGGRDLQDWYDANLRVNTISPKELYMTLRPNIKNRTNLMFKPSLELLKWTNTGSSISEFSTEQVFVGEKSLKITCDGTDTNISAPHGFDDFSIPNTGIYTISAYFWIPELSPLENETIEFIAEDGWADIETISSSPATLVAGEWSRASATFQIDDITYLGRFSAHLSYIEDEAIIYTDAWLLENTNEVKPYFDGSTNSYADWVGPEFASVSTVPEWFPEGTDWNENSFFKFNWAELFSIPVNSVYGIFEVIEDIDEQRPLIHFVNSSTNQRMEINISGTTVSYSLDDLELYSEEITIKEKFVAGLNIQIMSQYFGPSIASFFSSLASIKMYVGGNAKSGSDAKTFEGRIYKVGIMNENDYRNLITTPIIDEIDNEWAFTEFFERELDGGIPTSIFENVVDGGDENGPPSTYFNEYGVVEQELYQDFHYFFCMYGLIPLFRYGRYFLDIEISGEWEEYFPLSYFATYVKDANLERYYDLDYLQINFAYDGKKDFITVADEGDPWDYSDLFDEYNNPFSKLYETLDNEIITNYTTYNSLKNNASVQNVYTFEDSPVKGYITFQLLSDVGNRLLSAFINRERLDESRVIIAENTNSPTNEFLSYFTRYEFTDNTLVYPPKAIDFKDVAIVFHFTFNHRGILSTPLNIRDFEIHAKTYNETVPTEIGTKYGSSVYPFSKQENNFNYKEPNPIAIYVGNTPYLYTTATSGIRVGNKSIGSKEYGIKIPINQQQTSNIDVAAMQFWFKYEFIKFAKNGISLLEIDCLDKTIEFVVVKDFSEDRGIIYAKDKRTGNVYTDIMFYQNGVYVQNPIIQKNEWNSIGVTFLTPLSFNNYYGAINLFAGAIFNNVSYYLPSGLGRITNVITRPWLRVLSDSEINPTRDLIWQDWYIQDEATKRIWKQLYLISETSSYIFGPQQIHQSYIGTNKNVVDDNSTFSVGNNYFSYLKNVSWTRYIDKPV
jgi:hypothetical protein